MATVRSMVSLVGLGWLLAGSLAAQQSDDNIDRIVAVVGNKAIVATQLQERAFAELAKDLPADPKERATLLKAILNALIDEELVVQEAQRDTAIKVTDEEVTQSVDELFRNARGRYNSEEQFRKDLADAGFMTLEEWRSYSSDQQRRRFLSDRFWDQLRGKQHLKSIAPTDKEVRECFDTNCMRLQDRPEALSFRQIVIGPTAPDTAKARARAVADSILIELRKGGDFAVAARRFSMDPATRDQGGSLNWIRRGQGWDPKFEDAAFTLRVGQISDPVETAFGIHLIQVERAQPAEIQVRHILLTPTVDSASAAAARKRAEDTYLAIKNGADLDSLQRLLHDKSDEREANQFPINALPPAYANAVRDVKEGELAPLFQIEQGDPNRAKHVVLRVITRIPAGPPRFDDVKDQIRNRLGDVLARRKYLDRMRLSNHVEVRDL
ncbi:MAG: peptidylprolyl isomerase [Gemmatimonadales bacterium]